MTKTDVVAMPRWDRRNLLSIEDLRPEGIRDVLDLADRLQGEPPTRATPEDFHHATVATVFFENSTRTRLSFELAAQQLSAKVLNFNADSSSVKKGESLRDTLSTIDAFGVDVIVIRHASSGVAVQASRWVNAAIINAGDGQHEHPTQALLDLFTLRQALGTQRGVMPEDLTGLRVAIVGDIRHSRVARSEVLALSAMGAHVTLVAPSPLLPTSVEGWPIEAVSSDLDHVIANTDLCYVLRIQHERMVEARLDDLDAYRHRFGLTLERAARLPEGALIMHPGPINRGVEIDSLVADAPNSLILAQVRNGVTIRAAVLSLLLGARRDEIQGAVK